jgi:hypothetical protein
MPKTVLIGGRTLAVHPLTLGSLKRGMAEKIDKGAKLFTLEGSEDLTALFVECFRADTEAAEKIPAAWFEDHMRLDEAPGLLTTLLEESGLKTKATPGEATGP